MQTSTAGTGCSWLRPIVIPLRTVENFIEQLEMKL